MLGQSPGVGSARANVAFMRVTLDELIGQTAVRQVIVDDERGMIDQIRAVIRDKPTLSVEIAMQAIQMCDQIEEYVFPAIDFNRTNLHHSARAVCQMLLDSVRHEAGPIGHMVTQRFFEAAFWMVNSALEHLSDLVATLEGLLQGEPGEPEMGRG